MTTVRCTVAQEIIVAAALIPSRPHKTVKRESLRRGGGFVVCITLGVCLRRQDPDAAAGFANPGKKRLKPATSRLQPIG